MVTTPPTSLLKRGRLNNYVNDYADTLMQATDFAVWDLYTFTGGLMGAIESPQAIHIARDKIHYTRQGYINQGTALANAILNNYKLYKQQLQKQKD